MITALFWSLLEMTLLQSQDSAAAKLLRDADQVFGAQNYAEALPRYRACSEQAAKDGDRAAQVESLAQVARCYSIEGKLDEGRPWLERAEKLATADEPLGWSRCLGVRGIFQRESGDKTKAKATFEEMHRYCVEKKLFKRAIDAIHHIAIVVPPAEQPAWALKGIAAAEQLKDEALLAILWNNLGATYEDLKQVDAMLEAYLKAREYHHRTGGPLQKMIADWAVGHGYRLAGKLPEAETWLKKALPQALDLHAKEPRPDTVEWVGWCRKDLGELLLARGEKAAALELLKQARAALVEAGIDKSWPEGFKSLEEALEKAR
ncbi:MAG TPA: tetratricopeptide repeat protein [Planctomycetota bacterium]|jgi:tetratricopeptide (TPR) repeat protein|nr:tetratricopeptide repeat protein [Planctomycetota bacterium]